MHGFGLKHASSYRIKDLCVNLQVDKRNIIIVRWDAKYVVLCNATLFIAVTVTQT